MRNSNRTVDDSNGVEGYLSLVDIIAFLQSHLVLIVALALVGAGAGFLFRWLNPIYSSTLSLESVPPDWHQIEKPVELNRAIEEAFRRNGVARAYAQEFLVALESPQLTSDPKATAVFKEALDYFVEKFGVRGPDGTPDHDQSVLKFATYLSGPMATALSDFLPLKMRSPQSDLPYVVYANDANAWRIILQTDQKGLDLPVAIASAKAITVLATQYNAFKSKQRYAAVSKQAAQAEESFKPIQQQLLGLKPKFEAKRTKLKIAFYRLANRLARLEKKAASLSASYASSQQGNKETSYLLIGANPKLDQSALDTIDAIEMEKVTDRLAALVQSGVIDDEELNRHLTELDKISNELTTLAFEQSVPRGAYQAAQDGLAEAVKNAIIPPEEDVGFALSGAVIDYDIARLRYNSRSYSAFRQELIVSTSSGAVIGLLIAALFAMGKLIYPEMIAAVRTNRFSKRA